MTTVGYVLSAAIAQRNQEEEAEVREKTDR